MPEVLVLKREHRANIGSDDLRGTQYLVEVMKKVAARADTLTRASLEILWPRLAEVHFDHGYAHFERGELAEAAGAFRQAWHYAPSSGRAALYCLACMLPAGLVASVRKLKAGRRGRLQIAAS